jgi:hypothetical protein
VETKTVKITSTKYYKTWKKRLLEAEKAQLERDKEKQRESNEWLQNLSQKLSGPYQEYIKQKKNQQELLRTIPPTLTPFYKNKVNQYFKNDQQ